MMANTTLPPELIDIVVDLVSDDFSALRALSLVARPWIPRTRHHLFHAMTETVHSSGLYFFLALLDTPQSTLGAAITELHIRGVMRDGGEYNQTTPQCVINTLKHVPNLRVLRLRSTHLSYGTFKEPKLSFSGFTFKHLNVFYVEDCSADAPHYLLDIIASTSRSVDSLRIVGTRFQRSRIPCREYAPHARICAKQLAYHDNRCEDQSGETVKCFVQGLVALADEDSFHNLTFNMARPTSYNGVQYNAILRSRAASTNLTRLTIETYAGRPDREPRYRRLLHLASCTSLQHIEIHARLRHGSWDASAAFSSTLSSLNSIPLPAHISSIKMKIFLLKDRKNEDEDFEKLAQDENWKIMAEFMRRFESETGEGNAGPAPPQLELHFMASEDFGRTWNLWDVPQETQELVLGGLRGSSVHARILVTA